MKNTLNIFNNLTVIPNTYIYTFFNRYWKPSMLFDSFDHAIQDKSERQRANGKVHSSVIQNGSLTRLSGAAIIHNKPALFIHKYHCNKGLSKL